ncbi:MAG: hypothetical protein FGM46_08415 [Ferruginibacter sp.]|nr:hypothetical protein [Ferruginibacter sp.]
MNKKLLAFFILFNFLFLLSSQAQTVTIGTQVWMTENLNVDQFRNGDMIPEAKTNDEWKKATEECTPAWCYLNSSIQNGSDSAKKYGKLYNWYAVNDPRGLAPKGWHIPSYDEWTLLAEFLGGDEVAGYKMKSKSAWKGENNGTNSSGFSALPGGLRGCNGKFYSIYEPCYRVSYEEIGLRGYWWTSTERFSNAAWCCYLNNKNGKFDRFIYAKHVGLFVRCVRD